MVQTNLFYMKKVLLMMMVLVTGLASSANAQSGYYNYLTISLGESNILPVQAQVSYVEFSTPWSQIKNLSFNSIGTAHNIPVFSTGSTYYKMTQITISCSHGSVTFSASEIPGATTDTNSKTVGDALITIKNDGDGLYEIAANALP